jgi:hypothetical protein
MWLDEEVGGGGLAREGRKWEGREKGGVDIGRHMMSEEGGPPVRCQHPDNTDGTAVAQQRRAWVAQHARVHARRYQNGPMAADKRAPATVQGSAGREGVGH